MRTVTYLLIVLLRPILYDVRLLWRKNMDLVRSLDFMYK